MKAVVDAFNQEKALVGAFSVITNLRMELFEARVFTTVYCSIRSIGASPSLHCGLIPVNKIGVDMDSCGPLLPQCRPIMHYNVGSGSMFDFVLKESTYIEATRSYTAPR